VDYEIIKNGCNHTKRAFKMATKAKRKYKYGQSSTKRVKI
jgi:hypothetical protein